MRLPQVRQRDYSGCGIACVAMLSNKTYREVKKQLYKQPKFKGKKIGFYTEYSDIEKLLSNFKLRLSKIKKTNRWSKIRKRALVAVNYRKIKKSSYWHWVVFEKEKQGLFILDPQSTRRDIRKRNFNNIRLHSFAYVIPK
jgi:ABC-type bacteriocin/lantibiotic exporter with double-glycine peptidase domain